VEHDQEPPTSARSEVGEILGASAVALSVTS
jgi:hypothetical protein